MTASIMYLIKTDKNKWQDSYKKLSKDKNFDYVQVNHKYQASNCAVGPAFPLSVARMILASRVNQLNWK